MGFPICCEEYTKGADCLACFEPGMTPKYVNATFSGVEICPDPWCHTFTAPWNGRWLLTQVPGSPCWWRDSIIMDAVIWTCTYIAAPQSGLAVFTPGIDIFGSGPGGACQTSFGNALVCLLPVCGVNGTGVITINFAADTLRGAGLWPSRVQMTNGVWRYTNTWYEKNIKSTGHTTFRFADDTKNLHLLCQFDPFLKEIEVRGMIVLWSGAVVDIPPGWHLCDGNDGTPDLTDRFVVGAGDTYNPDDVGGSDSHAHDFTGDGHTHAIIPIGPIQFLIGLSVITAPGSAVGTTDPENHLPPYYALCYIMKL